MEEDIKILENYLNYECVNRKISPSEILAIENLITRNKELEVINKMQEYRISVIDERELILKSKVKEKIEKLEKYREKHFYFQKDLSKAKHDKSMKMLGAIRVLQELLEES